MQDDIVLLMLLSICALLAMPARACDPVAGGETSACAAAPASNGNTSGTNVGAGNPLNVITGNKYQREVDMPALPGVLGLEIVRHYNSAYSGPKESNGLVGRGWKLSYETGLQALGQTLQIVQADGTRVIFGRTGSSLCHSANPADGSLLIDSKSNGSEEFTWTWIDGRQLRFDTNGKLVTILAPGGEFVSLIYDNRGVLVKVIDPQGRSLTLSYPSAKVGGNAGRFAGVQAIDSPVGRFHYDYGSAAPEGSSLPDPRILWATLVRVRGPAGGRLYHYESATWPTLLTGISIQGGDGGNEGGNDGGKTATQRYASFGYDGSGRAVLSTHAGGVGKVTLRHGGGKSGGQTVLTNSLGQTTLYRHAIIAGEYRLLEVRGAGCSSCGEANVRYDYDKLARLTGVTRLTTDGQPWQTIKTERDSIGRAVKVSRVSYRDGQAGRAQLLTRYEYEDSAWQPFLIARPSVVPGREAVTRIACNDKGQVVSVTDNGWAPAIDGKSGPASIERTTRYRYRLIKGRSLLVEIDGPLANGKTNSPLDSDVTRIDYDVHGDFPVRTIAPGEFVTEVLERDLALRPNKIRTTGGDLIQVANIHSNGRGQLDEIEIEAGPQREPQHRKFSYRYRTDGQLLHMTQPGNLSSAFEYDRAGRMIRLVLPDGSGVAIVRDTENRTGSIARHRDMASPAAPALSSSRFDYDQPVGQPSQLSRIADVLGVINNYRHNDVGQLISIANALGNTTAYSYDADGLLTNRTDAAGSTDAAALRLSYDKTGRATRITAANGVVTLRRFDDFGRKVFEADPDHGITLLRYDAAGRLMARIDETLATTRYSYDHAGRLLALGQDQQPNLLQYRYSGKQLIGMVSTSDGKLEHATERTEYQRDVWGQVIREVRWIAKVDRAPDAAAALAGISFVTSNAYDEAGRLVLQILPDGHRLQYRYASADGTTLARTRRRPGQLDAILFDERIIVTDIEQTVVGGLTGYSMSNGMRQQIGFDRRERIAQLHTLPGAPTPDSSWWSRIKAWFSEDKVNPGAPHYHQVNRYDEAGRIVRIDRQLAAPRHALVSRQESYAYDRLDRLTFVAASDGTNTSYRYDMAGNRIAETVLASATLPASGQRIDSIERRYRYAQGNNWLIAATQATPEASQSLRSAWFFHPTGVPLAQFQWQNENSAPHRRIVYNSNRRPVTVYQNEYGNGHGNKRGDEHLMARYHYNSLGERIAKTVYPVGPTLNQVAHVQPTVASQGGTTYSLYRDQRLAAETDGSGRITAHYVYLYGKPVAKIEMEANTATAHSLWKTISMQAGTETDASDTVAHVYAIVTDHLGTPQQVIDARRQLVWQATTAPFGQAQVLYAAPRANGKPFEMHLRLPGQVFDAETKLHYNYLRDYDPSLGRYMTPDPVGPGSGFNPYAYVSNNPLVNIDPLGLYQIDVHYYMTYFLAITAGVDKDVARKIALATQYIDDNPLTEPMLPDGLHPDSLLINEPALLRYHFVQDGYDPPRNAAEILYKYIHFGVDSPNYIARRIANPTNPQLDRLLAASNFAKTDPNATCNSSAQLFGEYLHAFEDTFAHRSQENAPYPPIMFGLGSGHFIGGKNPDYTYNHFSEKIPGIGFWNTNEARTLEMEKEVFLKMQSFSNPGNAQYSISAIKYTLDAFNSFKASEDSGDLAAKIAILNDGLKTLGYKNIVMVYKSLTAGNNPEIAKENRDESLNRLNPNDYIGTILPQGATTLPESKK